jgi:hypothetical protein
VETPTERSTVLHLSLPDFDLADFIKFLRSDSRVEDRIRRGELPRSLLEQLFRALGGTPGFLDHVRFILRSADIDTLISELDEGEQGHLGEARDAHIAKVLAARLYESLPQESRSVTARLAVSELPIPLDAVVSIAGNRQKVVQNQLQQGVALGLIQRLEEADLPALFQVPGILRYWLKAPERLPEPDAQAVHRHLAVFWRACFENEREEELRVAAEVVLLTCRSHAALGEFTESLCWATVALAGVLERRFDRRGARAILEQIPDHDRDVACWLELAPLKFMMGELGSAQDDLVRALDLHPPRDDLADILSQFAWI